MRRREQEMESHGEMEKRGGKGSNRGVKEEEQDKEEDCLVIG